MKGFRMVPPLAGDGDFWRDETIQWGVWKCLSRSNIPNHYLEDLRSQLTVTDTGVFRLDDSVLDSPCLVPLLVADFSPQQVTFQHFWASPRFVHGHDLRVNTTEPRWPMVTQFITIIFRVLGQSMWKTGAAAWELQLLHLWCGWVWIPACWKPLNLLANGWNMSKTHSGLDIARPLTSGFKHTYILYIHYIQ